MNIEYFEAKKNRIHGSSFDEFNGILKKIVLDRLKSTNFREVIITKLANSRKSNFNIKNEKYILTTILAAESYHATFKAHTNHILTPEDTIGSTSV